MFKPARLSLRIKFSLIASLILLVIFTIASAIRILQTADFQKESLLARSETFAELATKPLGDAYTLYHNSGVLKLNDIFRQTLTLNDAVPRVQVISVTGDILFDTDRIDNTGGLSAETEHINTVDSIILQAVVSNSIVRIKDKDGVITDIIVPYSDNFGSRPFSLRYSISYDSINSSISQAIVTTVILNIILFLFILTAITILVNRSILSPLDKITQVAHAIGNGDLSQNIAVHTNDELTDLAISLNLMTTKLKNDIYDLQKTEKLKDEFITIASHNLRTPLTIIKGYLPSLKGKNLDQESNEIIDSIDTSVGKLNSITESLLHIVSLENAKQPIVKTEEDIGQIIRNIVDDYREIAAEKHITFSLNLPKQEVIVPVDLARIKQAFTNIIDNAVKFNKENGLVTIDLTTLENEIFLSVSDTGIGISPDEIEDIFQKFHRGTDIYTYDYEGIGLGLYLSKIVIEAHAGRIRITSKLGEGTNIYVSLLRKK